MDREWVRRLPKFDLHVHLDGSMRPVTVMELVRKLPEDRKLAPTPDIEQALFPPQRCTLEEYLKAFSITVAILQSEASLERAAYELCEDAAKENVIYMEIRFAPLLHLRDGLTPQQVVEAVLSGMHRAERTYPIRTRLILCAMKQESTDRSKQVAKLAAEYLGKGVVAFDLAGPEMNFPPTLHHTAIEIAKQAGLHVTIHAGEGCCPKQIKEAIDLGAERIGHGVYLFKDEATERVVAERGIPLEVCPTSNLQISGVMETYADHPLKRYLNEGIHVTLNTDNRLMSQINVTHEFEKVIEAFSLSKDKVRTILLNSAEAAFTTQEIKADLQNQVEAAFTERN
ncbi:TPA: adenosine deaminase [Candidatus Acetothermia bacterium]|nr:adenosine deaminase [Candidatus Acetothermia bacterium]